LRRVAEDLGDWGRGLPWVTDGRQMGKRGGCSESRIDRRPIEIKFSRQSGEEKTSFHATVNPIPGIPRNMPFCTRFHRQKRHIMTSRDSASPERNRWVVRYLLSSCIQSYIMDNPVCMANHIRDAINFPFQMPYLALNRKEKGRRRTRLFICYR
jgi:hypothetical protein